MLSLSQLASSALSALAPNTSDAAAAALDVLRRGTIHLAMRFEFTELA